MPLTEKSALDDALTRIIGEPPVAPATPAAALAPKTSVALGAPATSAALGAPQPVTPAPAPAPLPAPAPVPVSVLATTTAPAPVPAPVYSQYSQTRYTAGQPESLAVGTAAGEFTPVTRQNARDAEVRAALQRSAGELTGLPEANAGTNEALAQMQGYLNQPMGRREFLGTKGLTPGQFRGMGQPERQALRGEYQIARATSVPTPSESAMGRLTA